MYRTAKRKQAINNNKFTSNYRLLLNGDSGSLLSASFSLSLSAVFSSLASLCSFSLLFSSSDNRVHNALQKHVIMVENRDTSTSDTNKQQQFQTRRQLQQQNNSVLWEVGLHSGCIGWIGGECAEVDGRQRKQGYSPIGQHTRHLCEYAQTKACSEDEASTAQDANNEADLLQSTHNYGSHLELIG